MFDAIDTDLSVLVVKEHGLFQLKIYITKLLFTRTYMYVNKIYACTSQIIHASFLMHVM